MNNKGENFAQVLDRVLHGRGQGALIELAEQLGREGDLNASQVHGSLKEWRSPSNLRAGLTFDLALRVAVAVPELLRGLAREAGFVLVPVPGDRTAAADSARAIAGGLRRLAEVAERLPKGRIDEGELERVEDLVDGGIEDLEALRALAQVLYKRGSGQWAVGSEKRSTDCSTESGSERGGRPRHAGDESLGEHAALGKDQGVTGRRDGQACGAAALQAPATGDARPGVGGSIPPRSTNDGTNRTNGRDGAAARGRKGGKG